MLAGRCPHALGPGALSEEWPCIGRSNSTKASALQSGRTPGRTGVAHMGRHRGESSAGQLQALDVSGLGRGPPNRKDARTWAHIYLAPLPTMPFFWLALPRPKPIWVAPELVRRIGSGSLAPALPARPTPEERSGVRIRALAAHLRSQFPFGRTPRRPLMALVDRHLVESSVSPPPPARNASQGQGQGAAPGAPRLVEQEQPRAPRATPGPAKATGGLTS